MKEKTKKKCTLPTVDDITKYELQMEKDKLMGRFFPVRNTYVNKKTGEVVKIDYRDGAFRLI